DLRLLRRQFEKPAECRRRDAHFGILQRPTIDARLQQQGFRLQAAGPRDFREGRQAGGANQFGRGGGREHVTVSVSPIVQICASICQTGRENSWWSLRDQTERKPPCISRMIRSS